MSAASLLYPWELAEVGQEMPLASRQTTQLDQALAGGMGTVVSSRAHADPKILTSSIIPSAVGRGPSMNRMGQYKTERLWELGRNYAKCEGF